MKRKILVIHEFSVVRKIVTNYALSELGEMEVVSADNAQEGLRQLETHRFDLVFCAMELKGVDGGQLHQRMRQTGLNQDTPFILMTATDSLAQGQRLSRLGIPHVLVIPFTSAQLRQEVNKALDSHIQRDHQRFAIPGVLVEFSFAGGEMGADAINLSEGGLLCELEGEFDHLNLMAPAKVNIIFPEDRGGEVAAGITAVLVRLQVLAWNFRQQPVSLRTAWRFAEVPPVARDILRELLGQISQEMAQAEAQMAAQCKD